MFRAKILVILVFILTISWLNSLAQKEDVRKLLKEKLRGIEETRPTVPQEAVIQEIIDAYKAKDYDRIVILEKKLSKLAELKPEEMLILAEGLWLAGEADRAIDWAKRVASLRRETVDACRANFIVLSSLYLLEKTKEAKNLKEELKRGFCGEVLATEIPLLEFLYEGKEFEGEIEKVKKLISQVLYAQFNNLLKKGKLDQAEKTAYRYFALTGDYVQGGEFFFKLAEAYLAKGDRALVKSYYQLVISEWDLSRASFLSKFRLYQLAYERARGREPLPQRTYEDLLGYITQIKSKYGSLPIAEEASALEFEIYYDLKNWERARSSIKEFLSKYPESNRVQRVKELFCKVMVNLSKDLLEKKRLGAAQAVVTEDEELLQDTRCGDPFYLIGDVYFQNLAYLGSLGPFAKALLFGVNKDNKGELLLKLSFIAFQKGETALFQELFSQLERSYKREVSDNPYYLYLKAYQISASDLKGALSLFEKVCFLALPSYLKIDLINHIYRQAIARGNLGLAYDILKHPAFNAKESDYVLLLSLSFNRDLRLFEAVFAEALKKYPDSPGILLISALYYEKKGNLKESAKAWQRLSQQNSELASLGQRQKKLEELFDKARGLVY
jgi:hypothetical protein